MATCRRLIPFSPLVCQVRNFSCGTPSSSLLFSHTTPQSLAQVILCQIMALPPTSSVTGTSSLTPLSLGFLSCKMGPLQRFRELVHGEYTCRAGQPGSQHNFRLCGHSCEECYSDGIPLSSLSLSLQGTPLPPAVRPPLASGGPDYRPRPPHHEALDHLLEHKVGLSFPPAAASNGLGSGMDTPVCSSPAFAVSP